MEPPAAPDSEGGEEGEEGENRKRSQRREEGRGGKSVFRVCAPCTRRMDCASREFKLSETQR